MKVKDLIAKLKELNPESNLKWINEYYDEERGLDGENVLEQYDFDPVVIAAGGNVYFQDETTEHFTDADILRFLMTIPGNESEQIKKSFRKQYLEKLAHFLDSRNKVKRTASYYRHAIRCVISQIRDLDNLTLEDNS